ncbi:MAG: glycerol-3-phosphate 1-O-acyltransferase PlsY [Clostridia bacterium]|nr:glycerol-3-phosphate 1-O-acyltransferase PlsY [Clostridia bacterium]
MMIIFICLLLLSYLIGCFNTSIVYSIGNYKKDIRTQGSGNPGATNMLRSFGKVSAAITFAGDLLKAVVAIGIAWLVFKDQKNIELIKALMGLACVLGHCFPVFFKFKGGKGIATGSGCILMLDWRVFLIALALFALMVVLTKYVSLGSIVGALTYPIGIAICGVSFNAVIVAILTTALVIYRHKKNIVALFKGTERKIGSAKV